MKQIFKKSVSFLLAFVMVAGIFASIPFTAFAANDYTINSTESTDDYYNLISKKDWEIAPGITESEIVLNNDDGSQRQVLFVMEADLNNEYVKVINSYTGMVPEYGNYTTGVMSQQAALAEKLGYGNVVGAMNTCLSWYNTPPYTTTSPDRVGEPLGFIMLDAEILFDPANCGYAYGNVGFPSVLVINKDFDENGNPRPADIPKVEMPQIKSAADLDGWEDQVIPVSSGYIVKDGVNQSKPSHTGGAPRSVVGIKPDGTVVIMVNDGRQAPYSEGMSMYELAEVMLDLGCTYAVNCDGGGSTTWVSQRPGEELKVNNSPSDGAERPTTTGILFITTAPADGAFARATISTEGTYYTPGSKVEFSAFGTDLVGTPADIPSDVVWQLADPSMGSIENGVFVSNGKVGTVTAQMIYGGKVVGEHTIEIVIPTEFSFAQAIMTVPFDKEVTIGLNATINGGLNNVILKAEDVVFETTNVALGTFNGLKFTSVSEANAPANLNSTLTATFVHNPELVATAALNLGKGSEVLFDFENPSDVDAWNIADVNGNDKGFYQHLSFATSADGQVHNGIGSMRVEMNPIAAPGISNGGYAQSDLFLDNGIVVKNAKSIGFWAYIPDEYEHCWIRVLYWYDSNNDGKYDKKNTVTVINQPEVYNTWDESGWKYFSVDVSAYSEILIPGLDCKDKIGYNASKNDANNFRFIEFMFPHTNTNGLWKEYGTINGLQTVYIDNITADFSDAVDDREAPIFGKVELLETEKTTVLEKYVTVTTNSNLITLGTTVKENTTKNNATGLNADSAKAYVDGVEVPVTFSNGRMSINDVAVADGIHRVKFEICDNMGNKSVVIRLINVDSGVDATTIQVVPADPTLNNLYGGSIYWMNMNANKIETIQSVKAVIDLNYGNHFELDNMVLADGFTAEYTIDVENNTATIVITRTGKNTQTGAATLVALPIRVIYFDTDIKVDGYTAETFWSTYGFWPYDLKVDVDMGEITYVDGYTSGVLGAFSNEEFSVDTELQAGFSDPAFKADRGTAHVHTPVALDDKAATCAETGYTGRTYCAVCDSVVDWGTIIPVADHGYEVIEGKLTCVVGGELFNGVYTDGKTYVDGVAVADGWNADSTAYYVNGVKLTGSHIIDKVVYTFDDNGTYIPDHIYNGFITDNGVTMYFYTNTNYEKSYIYVGDVAYYFVDGIAKDGVYTVNGETCLFEGGKYISCSTASIMDAGWKGESVTYIIYADGRMILGGEGSTYKYTSRAQLPWVKYNKKITSIVIGKDITRLDQFALADIYYAKTITFEEGSKLEYIGPAAILSNYKMTEIVLPKSLKTIVQNAFKMCTALKDVYLPYNLSYIHKYSFVNNALNVMEDIHFHVYAGTYAEEYAKSYKIPYSYRVYVDEVVASGTCGANATWTLYESGKMIIGGSGAMDNYRTEKDQPWAEYRLQIKEVVIGKDITAVGQYAFGFAHYIEKVTFEEGSKLENIGAVSFYYMLYVTEIVLPETVTTIGNLAFGYCKALDSVYVPQGVESIHAKSFYNGPKVTLQVATPSYSEDYAKANGIDHTTRPFVKSILASGTCGANAIWTLYTDGQMIISGSGAMDNYRTEKDQPWAEYRLKIKEVVIGKDIISVGQYAFGFAHYIEKVTFEEGSKLESIGAVSFYYMLFVTEINLPDSVTSIGNLAFGYCKALDSVYVPQGVESIHAKSFYNSPKTTLQVATPSYAEDYAKANGIDYTTRPFVKSILASGTCGANAIWTLYTDGQMIIGGSGAMDNYRTEKDQPWAEYRLKIKEVVIGKDITSIGQYSFAFAHYIENVVFEEGSKLESIGAVSFYYMLFVTEINLPDSVTSIGNLAFGYCKKLSNITIPEGTTVHAQAFKNSAFAG